MWVGVGDANGCMHGLYLNKNCVILHASAILQYFRITVKIIKFFAQFQLKV